MKNRFYLLASIILPIAISMLGTQSAYWAGTISSSFLPSYIFMLFATSAGPALFAQIEFKTRNWSALAWAIYVPALLLIIFSVGFLTSCFNGDCI